MALSYVEYTASGSTNQFDITFDYIDRTHIKVYVDNVEDTSFTFINDNRIQTSSTPSNGAVVKLDRDTPTDARLVDFQDGSVLTETDLDKSANQNFYISQETTDEVASKLGQNNAGVYDALNKRIINVAEPTASSDAATKNYIDTQTVSAATSATNAANSATAAASSASAASTSETNAATSETNAATSETNASTSETNAASSATAAAASATAAAASETAAASSETAAASSETNAATSETNAATSATTASTQASNASTSATNAATSETNASNSATAAATSATNAATSESNASTSESNAASSASAASSSATAAANSASAASTSETNAATSESNASTSETNAATSASNASTSETNAATSASNASTSETNAATSASNASTSATNASNSATAAATSAAAAAASYDTFDDRYLGSKTSDPTLDNDGNALVTGALYFNSSANEMRVYDGANWIAASSAGTASLIIYEYTATSGQTTFSGSDDNAASLSYSVNNLFVTLNGVVLDPDDYTATSGTSIVLGTGATTGDLLTVHAFKSFTVSELNANNLTDGTIPDARFPAVLPAVDGSNLTGITSVGGAVGVDFNDNVKARFGTGNDLEIYHNGSQSIIHDNGTGNLQIRATNLNILNGAGTENYLSADENGAVNLYYDNSNKLQTTSTGAKVSGSLLQTEGSTGADAKVQARAATIYTNLVADDVTGFNAIDYSHNLRFRYGTTEQMRLDSSGNLKFNSGYGSVATAYGCRAWVNFNGTGTVAIRDSGNVSSITDNTTGVYTVNFTTAMPDANYAFSVMSVVGTINYVGNQWLNSSSDITSSSIKFFAGYRQNSSGTGAGVDSPAVGVAIFR